MSEGAPAPLIAADADIAGMDGFMLDVQRLFASELWALSTGEEFKAALALWGRAWQQTPPCSLPDDERLLAAFSGAGARWSKVRTMALRGFIKCSDGRWYHPVLCHDALRAAEKRRQFKLRTKAATEARRKRDEDRERAQRDRNDQRNDQRNDDVIGTTTSDVTSVQGQGQGQGQGQDSKKERKSSVSSETAAEAAPGPKLVAPSERPPKPPDRPSDDPEKRLFDRGKAVLGKSSGGQITKLIRHCDGDLAQALDLIELAALKSNPPEYIGAVLKGDRGTDEVLAETRRMYREMNVI